MINKYEAYWIWEKNPDGTYKFRCISDEHPLRCFNCPFHNTVLCGSDIIKCVPTWNKVQKLMQEIYHESPVSTLFGKLLKETSKAEDRQKNRTYTNRRLDEEVYGV